jgi:hypothetical protein
MKVYLVGETRRADFLTLRAARLLAEADTVFHDANHAGPCERRSSASDNYDPDPDFLK